VISKRRNHELREQGILRKARTEITMANGAKQKAQEEFTAMICFAGEIFELNFLILSQATGEMLLGMDLGPGAQTRLKCGNLELTITEPEETPQEKEREQTTEEKEPIEEEIRRILETQSQVFEGVKGNSYVTTHKIYMLDDKPIKQRYYPWNPKQPAIVNKQVD